MELAMLFIYVILGIELRPFLDPLSTEVSVAIACGHLILTILVAKNVFFDQTAKSRVSFRTKPAIWQVDKMLQVSHFQLLSLKCRVRSAIY